MTLPPLLSQLVWVDRLKKDRITQPTLREGGLLHEVAPLLYYSELL